MLTKKEMKFIEIGIFGTGLGHNRFQVSLQASLDTILILADDKDVVKIEGEVFAFS